MKIPVKQTLQSLPLIESRVPKPEELVVLSQPLLDATIRVGDLLEGCKAQWAIAGDVAEVIQDVNVPADHITILTSRDGCDEITGKLRDRSLISPPRIVERKLLREAEVELKPYPVWIKSYNAGFSIGGEKVDVHGELRIRVGDWEWGDPLAFEPDYVQVVHTRVPVVPLALKKELYLGLGWIDRVKRINDAMMRRHHGMSLGQ